MTWRSLASLLIALPPPPAAAAARRAAPRACHSSPARPRMFATAGSRSVTLQWTAPAVNGGLKILNYTGVSQLNAAPGDDPRDGRDLWRG